MKSIKILIIIILVTLFTACDSSIKNENEKAKESYNKDLKEILKEGKLRALTTYSGTNYFLYRGQPMGFEYELLERFAEFLGVDLELSVANDIDSLFNKLNQGEVDIIADGLTITSDRKRIVNFTDYLYLTHQVLVQKKPDNWRKMRWSKIQSSLIDDAIELIGDTVSIRRNSSYFHRLKNLSEEIGGEIVINILPGSLSTEEIIKMVVDGQLKYTISDNNIASINASYYPVLNIEVPISFSQRIAWAVRLNSPELLKAVNEWLSEFRKEIDYYVIYNKYFKNQKDFRKRIKSEFYSLNNNKISKYDELIKINAQNIDWDWRLVTSLIYQESRFNPTAKSWAGAKGLMQIMPATAKELGVKDRANPEDNISGGIKYLKQIWKNFEMIEDSVQRTKFTMASYNCGYYHVVDAQNMANQRKLDRNIWDDNVENIILALSYPQNYNDPIVKYGYVKGIEPYTYIEQIFKRYEHYKQFIEK